MNYGQRSVVGAFQMSLDGYLQGANGEVDWVDGWGDALDTIPDADAALIGGGTYPDYEQLWGSIASDSQSGEVMMGRAVSDSEVEYARWTQRTPHYVVSTTIDEVSWDTATLIRDFDELRSIKEQPGGAIYVIGGPSLVSNLLNEGLIDELRLIVHPLILGSGKSPFAGIMHRQQFELVESRTGRSGRIVVTYRM